MAHKPAGPRLSKRERDTLDLIIQGMPIDRVSKTLRRSPKLIERYVHQGLRKLENWSAEAALGPSHNSAQDRELGFLRPQEAERAISRIISAVGPTWACLVLLAIPDKSRSQDRLVVADAIGRHIKRGLRGTDVVTKWGSTEWVIFLPRIAPAPIKKVIQRLRDGHNTPWAVYIAARQPQAGESFGVVATQCHQQLLAQYVAEDLVSYVQSTRER